MFYNIIEFSKQRNIFRKHQSNDRLKSTTFIHNSVILINPFFSRFCANSINLRVLPICL